MGHGSKEGTEAGVISALRKTREAQPFAGTAAAFEHTILERAQEPPGERLRRGRRLYLHGAV